MHPVLQEFSVLDICHLYSSRVEKLLASARCFGVKLLECLFFWLWFGFQLPPVFVARLESQLLLFKVEHILFLAGFLSRGVLHFACFFPFFAAERSWRFRR